MAALTPWKPMREIDALWRRMDEMFDHLTREFFGPGWGEPSSAEAAGWEPAIECYLDKGELIIRAEVPGVEAKDVNISVVGNELTIAGERKRDTTEEAGGYFYQELPYGKFLRKMTLPDGIDADKIKTAYKNGILEITMPAPKQLIGKKIPLEVQ
ncbi:MAG: Hsp20/alpha crystallin family protein [Thermodesulfobacteriota bacterium]|jgi:HSP20 family protein